MKASLPKLLRCRLVQASGLFALIAAVAASSAWSSAPEARVKLGGAWICQVETGVRGVVNYAPSDSSGLSATFRAEMIWPPEVLASMGLDAVTDEIGEEFVTGKNTSHYTAIWYGLAGGRIVLICLDNTTITHISPTQLTLEHTVAMYPATADTDNDGYPDTGTPVMLTAKSISKRVAR